MSKNAGTKALVRAGYTVLVAAGGEEAIRESESWPGWVDVLRTDVVMSGMHGPAVVERVREQRPGIGVLYTSGYAENAVGQGGELGTYGAFLPKPFTADAVVRAVQQVVELGLATQQPRQKAERGMQSRHIRDDRLGLTARLAAGFAWSQG